MAKKQAVKKPVKKPAVKRSGKAAGDLSHITEQLRPLAVDVRELTIDSANARRHADADLAALAGALEREGQVKPIVVNKATGVVIAGNGTLLAAKRLRWRQIAVVYVERDEAGHRRLAIADNRLAELSVWDEEQLLAQLDEMKDSGDELYSMLALDALEGEVKKKIKKAKAKEARAGNAEEEEGEPIYQVIIDVKTEREQTRIVNRLTKHGIVCRAVSV